MTRLIDMVVAKGRSVMHDGKVYGQHSRIMLPPNEAIRLEEMGFVLNISVVQDQLQDPDGGTGTPVVGPAGDGTGAAGDGSAGGDAGTATSNAAANNTTGKKTKRSGA